MRKLDGSYGFEDDGRRRRLDVIYQLEVELVVPAARAS